jgi:S-adenosylmethionine uptake transporter
MGVFVKSGAQHFNSMELLFWRTLIGTIILGGGIRWRGLSLSTPHWLGHIKRSFVGYLSMSALFYALTHLPLSTAVTLNYTSSLFFSLICVVKLKDKLSRPAALALGLGFLGIVLLLRPTFSSDQWLAGVMGLLSGVSAGFAVFQVRELGQMGEPSWRVVFWFFAIASVFGGLAVAGAGFFPGACRQCHGLAGRGRLRHAGAAGHDHGLQGGRKYLVASFAYLTVVFRPCWNAAMGRCAGAGCIAGHGADCRGRHAGGAALNHAKNMR